ncbi:MAG: tetratricopeptide repeat protein [Phycisphaerae bacterium]|nr:tetratricopeptide repeat protein [Phycisphaerae bacterium]
MKEHGSPFGATPEGLNRLFSRVMEGLEPEEASQATVSMDAWTERPGGQIGHYELISVLGEGGMGIVYLAEQRQPIRRRVALKVIKPGMDTAQVIARFEAERQALALLDHPSIARVFEAGTTGRGRPYFVMEHVTGLPVTRYCDEETLTMAERLILFSQICEAVQHAHHKGIIHRDLKPSNILVSLQDGHALPKIIDFGIAKAVTQSLTDRTLYTEEGQFVGTPEYMSPEQAEPTARGVDTRTDVYSLGVVLYELLTGLLPFDTGSLRQGTPEQIRRIIRETDPPRPSTRVREVQAINKSAPLGRPADAIKNQKSKIENELDWITLKAMDKDPNRRYDTPRALAEDIQRHLRHEPVAAGPPSTLYRMRKYVRRNQALVTGLAAVLVAVLAGMVGIVVFAVKAERQASTVQAVVDFLDQDLLGAVALNQSMGQQVTVRSILDTAAGRLEGRFADRPLVQAIIRQTLGTTYVELGDYKQAEPLLRRAYDLRRAQLGDEDPLTLTSMSWLGRLYLLQARYREAQPLLDQALASRRRLLGPDHADTLVNSLWLGVLYTELATSDTQAQAETLLRTTLDSGARVFGEESPIILEAMGSLAHLYGVVGWQYAKAAPLCFEGLETARRVLGEEHRVTAQLMGVAAWLEILRGQFNQALRYAETVLTLNQRVLGPDHPHTLSARGMLGFVYASKMDCEKAEPLLTEATQRLGRVLGQGHQTTIFYTQQLALVHMRQGHYQEAEDLLAKVIENGRQFLGSNHPLVVYSRLFMMKLYAMQERSDDLRQWCAQEIEKTDGTPGQDDETVGLVLCWLSYLQATYPSTAIRDGDEAIRNASRVCDLTPQSSDARYILAAAYAEAGDFASAVREQKKAIEYGRSTPPSFGSVKTMEYMLQRYESRHPLRDSFLTNGPRTKIDQGQYEAAEQELTTSLTMAKQYLGDTHPETRGCILALIELYEAWGKPQEAETWRILLPEEN